MNAAAVPCPDSTRSTMPPATVPSHAPTPAGTSPSGRRHPRTASQPAASPVRNGHAVEAMPATLSPLVWLARPMITNISTQAQSRTTATRTLPPLNAPSLSPPPVNAGAR
jgi:hypothetical protein